MARVHYNGTIELQVPIDHAYKFFTNPTNIVSVIPGAESAEVFDENNFRVEVMSGVGSIKGKLHLNVRFKRKDKEKIIIEGEGSGLASKLNFTLDLNLRSPKPETTGIEWQFDGAISGIVGTMGSRVLDPVAHRIVNDLINTLRQKIIAL